MHSLSDAEKCNAAIICCVNCYRGFVFTLLFTVMHTLSLSTSACYHVLCKLYLGFYRVLKVQSNITLYYVWHTAAAFLSGAPGDALPVRTAAVLVSVAGTALHVGTRGRGELVWAAPILC